jgi:hypothetical protein
MLLLLNLWQLSRLDFEFAKKSSHARRLAGLGPEPSGHEFDERLQASARKENGFSIHIDAKMIITSPAGDYELI